MAEQTLDELMEVARRRGILTPEYAGTGSAADREAAFSVARDRGLISQGGTKDLPMIGAYDGMRKWFFEIPGFASKGTMGEVANSAAASLLTSFSNDEETGQMLLERFPGSKIIQDEDGGTIFVSPEGEEFAIDKPGIDAQDVVRAISEVGTFGIFPGRTMMGAATQAGVKQTGIETAQELGGGDFDKGDIAAVAAGGALGQGAANVVGRGIGNIRPGAEQAIDMGNALDGPLLTSDVIEPNSMSAIQKFVTGVTDKYPFGTSGARASQREARDRIATEVAEHYNITSDMEAHPQAVADALGVIHQGNQARAVKLRTDAISMVDAAGNGAVPIPKTMEKIGEQITELQNIGFKIDGPLISVLEDVRGALPNAQDFAGMASARTRVIRLINEAKRGMNPAYPPEAAARLMEVKGVLDKEMASFASNASDSAARKWRISNELFFEEMTRYDRTILARIVSEGDLASNRVATSLAGTNRKDLKQLYRAMDEPARQNARGSIIQNALDKSGYFTDEFDARKFGAQLRRPNVREFFRGASHNELDGLTKYITATKDSVGAANITPTGFGIAELAAAPVAVVGRVYQSPIVRDLLVKLGRTNPNSAEGQSLIGQIRTFIGNRADEFTSTGAALGEPTKEELIQ